MDLEFRRLTGEVLDVFSFEMVDGVPEEEIRRNMREALMCCYDSDATRLWPKAAFGLFGTKAVPEQVVLVSPATGETSYTLRDLIQDTGLTLEGKRPA